MFRRAVIVICAFAAALAAVPAPPWATPPGGTVRALAADPAHSGVILLGTATGTVFRSTDAGAHWSFWARIGDHDDWVVSDLVADRAHPGHWFAALWSWSGGGGGVYRSNDGGRNWLSVWGGHPVRALAQAPSRPAVLVAATLDGVYRSQDGGTTWSLISPAHDRELQNIESVAIDPANPGEIYVGTWHLPWKTINGGHDWWQMRNGVIDDSDVFSITVDSQNPSTIYLSACSGIYRSDNRGNQFRKLQGIPYSARRTPALVQDPSDPRTIYAGTTQGLWVTRDQGATWSLITSSKLEINAVVALPHRLLLATNYAGIEVSTDAGRTFSSANSGFSSRRVAAEVQTPLGRYLAVTGDLGWGGVFLQSPSGDWTQFPPLPQRDDPRGLHWSPSGLLVATSHGVLRWSPAADHGRGAWSAIPSAPHGPIFALTGDAPGSARVYAAGPWGLARSDDGGARWSLMRAAPQPLYAALAIRDAEGHHWLWVAGDGFVVRSQDGGEHFLPGRLSLDGQRGEARISQLASLPSTANVRTLFAATTRGLYASADLGATWTLAGHGLPAFPIAAVHADAASVFAFGMKVGDVFRSLDRGATWQRIGLTPEFETQARLAPASAAPWQREDAVVLAAGTSAPGHR